MPAWPRCAPCMAWPSPLWRGSAAHVPVYTPSRWVSTPNITYIYIHTYIHTYTYTYTYIHTYTHTHTYIHTYTHTYIHTYIHIIMCTLCRYIYRQPNRYVHVWVLTGASGHQSRVTVWVLYSRNRHVHVCLIKKQPSPRADRFRLCIRR